MSSESLFPNVPSQWEVTTLGELAKASGGDIQTGPFGSQLHAGDYVDDGIPSIMPKNISVDAVTTDDIARVSTEDVERLSKYKVEVGDIVYSRRGDIEKCARITEKEDGWLCGTGCLRVRVKSQSVSTEYLHAYLCHPTVREWIVRHAVGATMPNLNTSILSALPVVIPSDEEMAIIASIWLSISDKIQLNHQINQTLEQMAQAIFKSWFVDFEPVKAKIAALEAGGSEEDALLAAMQAISGKGEAELTRLQAEQPEQYAELRATAELFPSAMQNSELGEIPEGWELSTIGEEFDVTMGQSPPGDTYNEEGDGVPFFQGRRDFGERFPSNRVYCSSPQRMANAGDTLLSVRAPVGDTNIALMHCCIGRGLAALRHKTGCSSYTYYTIIQLGQALASYDSEGTVFGSINQKNLKALPVVAPAPAVLAAFQQAVAPIDGLIRVNSEETASLADVRDALLPKLLSGELPVSDVEDQPTEVAESANV